MNWAIAIAICCSAKVVDETAVSYGVVTHPQQRPLVEHHQCLQEGDEEGPLDGRLPHDPALAHQKEQANHAAAGHVENGDGKE